VRTAYGRRWPPTLNCLVEYVSLIALGVVVLVFAGAHHWSIRRKFAASMADRTPLSESDFASLFPGAEESAIAVRQAVGTAVPGDASLMRPLDRIATDLMADATDGLNCHEIVAALERRFSVCIPEVSAAEVRTVQEL
jgi:hypothetical protein